MPIERSKIARVHPVVHSGDSTKISNRDRYDGTWQVYKPPQIQMQIRLIRPPASNLAIAKRLVGCTN